MTNTDKRIMVRDQSQELIKRITEATDAYAKALLDVSDAKTGKIAAEFEMQQERARFIASYAGNEKALGSNAEAREAAIAEHLKQYLDTLNDLEVTVVFKVAALNVAEANLRLARDVKDISLDLWQRMDSIERDNAAEVMEFLKPLTESED